MERPFFSVIIPARNAAATLTRCIDSLRRQSYPADGVEVIVVDHDSSDDTAAIAVRYGAAVYRGNFSCVSAVRNFGAHKARGRVLAFLDADIVADENWLAAGARYYAEGRFAGLLGFTDRAPPDAHWVGRAWNDPARQGYCRTGRTDFLSSRNMMIPADVFHAAGGFDESELFEGGMAGEDKDFSYRCSFKGIAVIRDASLPGMIHLGCDKSLAEFMRKEWWRQGNALHIAAGRGWNIRLLRAPCLAVAHVGMAAAVLAFMAMKRFGAAALCGLAWCVPSALILARRCDRRCGLMQWGRFWFLTWIRWNIAGCAIVSRLWRR